MICFYRKRLYKGISYRDLLVAHAARCYSSQKKMYNSYSWHHRSQNDTEYKDLWDSGFKFRVFCLLEVLSLIRLTGSLYSGFLWTFSFFWYVSTWNQTWNFCLVGMVTAIPHINKDIPTSFIWCCINHITSIKLVDLLWNYFEFK